MIFSLDRISEYSELNLAHASSLPILIQSSQFKLGDEFSYQFCDQISQLCGSFQVIPETQTLVLDYNGFCSNATPKLGGIINFFTCYYLIDKKWHIVTSDTYNYFTIDCFNLYAIFLVLILILVSIIKRQLIRKVRSWI